MGFAQVLHFVGAAIGLRVAFEVAVETAQLDLHQRRPLAAARTFHGHPKSRVYGEEVIAVDDHPRHAKTHGALGDVFACDRPARAGGFGVAVVFRDEQARQFHDRGQVHCLEHRALVGAAVAEKRHGHALAALELGRQRRPGRQGRAGTDDTVGAEHAFLLVGNVHGAALTTAPPGFLAVDLGHHAEHVHALGDAVAVATVVGGDAIFIVEVGHDPGGAGFLAGIQVDETWDLAGGEFHVQALFEIANSAHHGVGMKQLISGQVSGHLVVLQVVSTHKRLAAASCKRFSTACAKTRKNLAKP